MVSFCKIIKKYIFTVLVALFLSSTATASEISSRAMDLAGVQKFEQALELLSTASLETKNGYDHRFLKARILSWAGKYRRSRN